MKMDKSKHLFSANNILPQTVAELLSTLSSNCIAALYSSRISNWFCRAKGSAMLDDGIINAVEPTISLRQKLLDGSANPALIPATNQEVISCSSSDYSNFINQGNIAKVLQKIISAK